MRIIAGEFKGRPIKAPKGDSTRPTIDRVRESLMSSIASARGGFEDAVVLDLFAGSGALGLESISRGAASAVFCEKHPDALRALQSNVAMAGSARVRIVRGDVTKRLPRPLVSAPFDLVFLDPPYAMPCEDVAALIAGLRDVGSLAPSALIVYEHDTTQDPLSNTAFASLQLEALNRKKFGATIIDIFENGES